MYGRRMLFEPGMRLLHVESGVEGMVVPNYKLPGDICIDWDNGLSTSYDVEALEDMELEVLPPPPTAA